MSATKCYASIPIDTTEELRMLEDLVAEVLLSRNRGGPIFGSPRTATVSSNVLTVTAGAPSTVTLNSDETTRSLVSLSIDEVVSLLRNLDIHDKHESIIRRKNITGDVLSRVRSYGDIKELELPLSNARAILLLRYLEEYRQNRVGGRGVIAEFLHHIPDITITVTEASTASVADADATAATTVHGISDALSRLVGIILAGPLNAAFPSLHRPFAVEDRNCRLTGAALAVLDAISTFIGNNDDDGSKERMRALGANDTHIIENLKKILDYLLARAAASPSEPSYSYVSMVLVKTLVATQKMMRYDITDSGSSCGENIQAFLAIGTLEILPEIMKKYLQLEEVDSSYSTSWTSLVLSGCCKVIRSIITETDDEARVRYESVPGSIGVLVEVLRSYGLKNVFVAEHCCAAIIYVTLNHVDNTTKYGLVPGSMAALVDVLRYYYRGGDTVVTILCCWAIGNMTYANAGNKVLYRSVVPGSIYLLIDVLKYHCQERTDADFVTEYCCIAIRSITANDNDNKAMYGSVPGSIDALIDALRCYGVKHASLTSACCGAIANVASYDGNRIQFETSDVFSVLVDVLKAHGKIDASQNALEACCTAIIDLCRDNEINTANFNALKTIQVLQVDVTVYVGPRKRDAIEALRILVFFLEVLIDAVHLLAMSFFVAAIIMHMYNSYGKY